MTRLFVVLTVAALSGCMSLGSVASSPSPPLPPPPPSCSPAEAAAIPEGARVEVTWDQFGPGGTMTVPSSQTRRVGTVLKASPEGIALANCVVEQRNNAGNPTLSKVPHVGRLFRNTGVGMSTVPVEWIPISEIGQVRILEAPPAGYVPGSIEIDTAPHRPEFEQVGVNVDFVTGQVYVERGDSTTDQTYRQVGTVNLEESPGVQSPGRRTSGHGPATPDPGTAHLDSL